VPLSLGDSHRGFRVLGTERGYFEHFRYGGERRLQFRAGAPFDDLYDAVIGAEVAATLGYELGQQIVISHGLGSAGLSEHDDKPFRVKGILAPTGTPVDRTVHVSLQAIEAIHVDWQGGGRTGASTPVEVIREMDLQPEAITAALVGVESKLRIFALQRWINEYPEEPLLAILPGVALQELWQIVGVAETALVGVSGMVVVTALLGMMAMILSGLNERRREMAILRAVGARPGTILGLLVLEAMVMAALGALLGMAILYAGLALARPVIDSAFGLWLPLDPPGLRELWVLLGVVGAAALVSLLPALRAYRLSLADGMMVRI
jgi:putative ABC transport system permease protein